MNADFTLYVLAHVVIAVTLAWYIDSLIRYIGKKVVSGLPVFKKWWGSFYV